MKRILEMELISPTTLATVTYSGVLRSRVLDMVMFYFPAMDTAAGCVRRD